MFIVYYQTYVLQELFQRKFGSHQIIAYPSAFTMK